MTDIDGYEIIITIMISSSLYLPAEYVSHVHYPRPRLRVTAEAEALPVAALC